MANLEKLKLLLPMEEIEISAQQQIYHLLEYDEVKSLAIMPDCHAGYFFPIGSVALLDNVISPEGVGYDIGCSVGCIMLNTPYEDIVPDNTAKENIYNDIKSVIPVGFNKRNKPFRDYPEFKSATGDKELNNKVNENVFMQIGTLGQGNHMAEIGYSRDSNLAITIHSGSRKCGYDVADYYMNLAKKERVKFFKLDSDIGQAYLHDMNYFIDWAKASIIEMMHQILIVLNGVNNYRLENILKNRLIYESHNHAIITENGVLHRKGATPADINQLGIIPGNMRDGVYITEGLGNKEYLSSASHGAGRVLGRKAASKTFTIDDFKEMMKDSGVYTRIDENTIDECPAVYKDIHKVIKQQEGIVIETVDHIKPLINLKG